MRLVHMPLGVNCPEWMHKYLNGDWSGELSESANEFAHLHLEAGSIPKEKLQITCF